MLAIVGNNIAKEKIKQSLAGCFLHKMDPPQARNLGKGYSGWNPRVCLLNTIVSTSPLEGFKGVLTLVRKLFWSVASLLAKENDYVLTSCSLPGPLTGCPVLQYLCSEWQTLLNQNPQLLVPEVAFFTYSVLTWLEQITLRLSCTSKTSNKNISMGW